MPELRTDHLTGRVVIIAEDRALRPNEFSSPVAPHAIGNSFSVENCPFCPGNESGTPPAVDEQKDERGRWRLRAIPNKFPALSLKNELGPLSAEPAFGAHEVIVESARHVDRLSALSVEELRYVLEMYAARLRNWRDHDRLAYGLVFKNQGPRAGASLAHLHSQLIATPEIPPAVTAELHRAHESYMRDNLCPYCRLVECEGNASARVVFDRDGFIAFCPYASLQAHEVWLMPAAHSASFEDPRSEASRSQLAEVLHDLVARLETVLPDPSYNMLLRTAPWRMGCEAWFHWRIEFLPRTSPIAGLEFATGLFINPVAPERAAEQLRGTQPD